MVFEGKDYTFSYKTFGQKEKQAIMIFPPGIGFSSRFENLAKKLATDYYVITPDMPGVGESMTSNGNLQEISGYFIDFIDELDILDPILIGYCHGGCVAIEIAKRVPIKKLILMGIGEYFEYPMKLLLHTLFLPTLVSKWVRKLFAVTLTYFSHFKFDGLNDQQVKIINERWIETIWFRLPKNVSYQVRTLLIHGEKDIICNSASEDLLELIYPNHEVVICPCNHSRYIQDLKSRDDCDIKNFLIG